MLKEDVVPALWWCPSFTHNRTRLCIFSIKPQTDCMLISHLHGWCTALFISRRNKSYVFVVVYVVVLLFGSLVYVYTTIYYSISVTQGCWTCITIYTYIVEINYIQYVKKIFFKCYPWLPCRSHQAINACLAPLCSMHHCAVTTVEGIGSVASKLHPVQVWKKKYLPMIFNMVCCLWCCVHH